MWRNGQLSRNVLVYTKLNVGSLAAIFYYAVLYHNTGWLPKFV
jgi:hypothetical protein